MTSSSSFLRNELIGKVLTATSGPLTPSELGVTLVHEHLLLDFSVALQPSPSPSAYPSSTTSTSTNIAHSEITLENLGWIRQHPYSHLDNLRIIDEEEALKESKHYKQAGGGTIVDVTPRLPSRDPFALQRIGLNANLHLILGGSFYVDFTHPPELKSGQWNEEDLAKLIVKDILEGIDESGIHSGIIGEIGISWPMSENERKVLRASSKAQQLTGAPITIHPGRDPQSPLEIVRVLAGSGANMDHVSIGHLDRTIFDSETLLELARSGCYLQFDLFGVETSHYQLDEKVDMPSDAQRIGWLKFLTEQGYLDKLLISHDIHTKHRWKKYGGHGYSHILTSVVPKMLSRGFTLGQVDRILVTNPQRFLCFF